MNIYVGNIPQTGSEDAIRKEFSVYGQVDEVKLIKDHFSGELRGFGFVQMPDASEAANAIKEINGIELNGRKLVVNEAKPRNNRQQRSNNRYGSNNRSW